MRKVGSIYNAIEGLNGGAEGNRTPDLCSAIAALSHLSYGPELSGRHLGGHLESCQGTGTENRFRTSAALPRGPCKVTRQPEDPHQEHVSMIELLGFISYLITLYIYVIIASVIMSWLMAFGVINPYNPTARAIWQGLSAVTEPLLRPIRNVMPDLGAIDISPIVLLLGCFFVQSVIIPNIAKLFI